MAVPTVPNEVLSFAWQPTKHEVQPNRLYGDGVVLFRPVCRLSGLVFDGPTCVHDSVLNFILTVIKREFSFFFPSREIIVDASVVSLLCHNLLLKFVVLGDGKVVFQRLQQLTTKWCAKDRCSVCNHFSSCYFEAKSLSCKHVSFELLIQDDQNMQSPYRPTEFYRVQHTLAITCNWTPRKGEKAEDPLHFPIFSRQWSAVKTTWPMFQWYSRRWPLLHKMNGRAAVQFAWTLNC